MSGHYEYNCCRGFVGEGHANDCPDHCTRAMPKALAPRGHVYEHGRCRQCNVTEPPAVGYGQPSAREGR